MTNTITITNKDGQVWNIHKSAVAILANKTEDELCSFFKRFFAWFDTWEMDVLLSLIRMEREGLAIADTIELKFNR